MYFSLYSYHFQNNKNIIGEGDMLAARGQGQGFCDWEPGHCRRLDQA